MEKNRKLIVEVTRSSGWYTKGETHEVNNYLTFGYCGGDAHFEKRKGSFGISLSDCVVIGHTPENIKEFCQSKKIKESELVEWLNENYTKDGTN